MKKIIFLKFFEKKFGLKILFKKNLKPGHACKD